MLWLSFFKDLGQRRWIKDKFWTDKPDLHYILYKYKFSIGKGRLNDLMFHLSSRLRAWLGHMRNRSTEGMGIPHLGRCWVAVGQLAMMRLTVTRSSARTVPASSLSAPRLLQCIQYERPFVMLMER